MLPLLLLVLPLLTRTWAQQSYTYGPGILPSYTDSEDASGELIGGVWSHTSSQGNLQSQGEYSAGPVIYSYFKPPSEDGSFSDGSVTLDSDGRTLGFASGRAYLFNQPNGGPVRLNNVALVPNAIFVTPSGGPVDVSFTLYFSINNRDNSFNVFTFQPVYSAAGSTCGDPAYPCDPSNGAQCVNGRCQVPLGRHCSSTNECADGVQCSTADFCPAASPSFVTGCDNSCATDEASTCGGSGTQCSVDSQCASGLCYLGQCVSAHASSSGCSCTYDIQCNVAGGLRCSSGLCATPGTLGDMCYSNGDCPSGTGCGNQQCGGSTAPCLADDGEVTGDSSACLSGYCNQQQCSARLPRGASCSNPYDCDTPDFDPSNPSGYVHCQSGICGGKYAFCPYSPSTDGQLDPDWCAAGLSCIANSCQLAPSAGTRRRRRQLAAGTMNRQKIWGSELDSSGLRCTGGSIKCPAGSGYECIDPSIDLESCGGCPGAGGVDCSALPHVGEVACVLGQCVVHRCMDGFTLSNQTCIAI